MARALELAERPGGRPSPNPNVGAVALDEATGAVLAEGHHRAPGGPHAERVLLEDAARRSLDLRGSTLVSVLEPCVHQGRTPPCAPAVAAAGFARVVIALRDPNPLVDGRGAALLREREIEVVEGIGEAEARRLLEGFALWVRRGRPFVHVKMAMLPDGTVHRGRGFGPEISGEASRRLVHRWRHLSPAVAVGAGTLRSDDPRLTVRRPPEDRELEPWQPRRVVLASGFDVDPAGHAFDPSTDGPAPLVIGSSEAPPGAEAPLASRDVETARVAARGGRVDLRAALELLGRMGVTSVLVEGGPTLANALLAKGLVDRLSVFVAGGAGARALEPAAGRDPSGVSPPRAGASRWLPPGGLPYTGSDLHERTELTLGADRLVTGLLGNGLRQAS